MSDERSGREPTGREPTGRELTPRPEESLPAVPAREPPPPPSTTTPADRFYAGDQAHTVGTICAAR